MKNILMIIAPTEFRDEEYFKPREIFENEGFDVITASKGVQIAKGKLGGTTRVDLDIDEVDVADYDAIVFVGGMGALVYKGNEIIDEIITEAQIQDKLICAICIAPTILAENGILKGKKATVWDENGEQSKLFETKGVHYTGDRVTVAGNFVTGNGPDAAKEFAKKIVEILN